MKKFDFSIWSLLDPKKGNVVIGTVHVKASKPTAFWITDENGETKLLDYGTDCRFVISRAYRITVDKNVVAYIANAPETSREKRPEIFTNPDQRPDESGSQAFVKQGLRILEMQRKNMMADIMAKVSSLKAAEKPEQTVETEEDLEEKSPSPKETEETTEKVEKKTEQLQE